jgi:hypothetical protein
MAIPGNGHVVVMQSIAKAIVPSKLLLGIVEEIRALVKPAVSEAITRQNRLLIIGLPLYLFIL